MMTKDCNGLNAGSIIWKNSPWSRTLLERDARPDCDNSDLRLPDYLQQDLAAPIFMSPNFTAQVFWQGIP